MKNHILSLFILLFLSQWAMGHDKWKKMPVTPSPAVCYASGKVEKSFIPPPADLIIKLKSAQEKTSEINVTYVGFPDSVKSAFEYAVSLWEGLLESDVPINITARWNSMDNSTLASCGPSAYYQNLEDLYYPNHFYAIAIAEKLAGEELSDDSSPDITATFNKNIEWYYGIDGDCPITKYDFVSTVMHEIAHGLGFTGFFYADGSTAGYYEPPAIFDHFVTSKSDQKLIDTTTFQNPSNDIFKVLTSNALYFNSPAAIFNNDGIIPKLYAPLFWSDGSSVYHLNDATYPSGSQNSLMTHAAGYGEVIHDPGPITMGILADIGWKALKIKHEELKDLEFIVDPVWVDASITSDYTLDSASLFVYFSDNNFNSYDSVLLAPTGTETIFSAQLPVDITEGIISYYFSATDEKQRTFYNPQGAPEESFKLRIGPDTISPEIEHQPKEYILSKSESYEITAFIDDNIGIDTAWVEYFLNNEDIQILGMSLDSNNVYSCSIDLLQWSLQPDDKLKYKIYAQDNSSNANISFQPQDKEFVVVVEETIDPIYEYSNTFNDVSNDFIGSDFNIKTEPGFIDGALHSPHPYPSPDEDNIFLNFTSVLKYPIILAEDGEMSFDEIVLVEPGEPGTVFGDDKFWDYVIVEGSKDYGETWLPLIDGYDSRSNTTWSIEYNLGINENNSETVGEKEMYIRRNIELLANGNFIAGDTIFIRFRLHSDPYAHGWGWVIDNLLIQKVVSNKDLQTFSPGNFRTFPNPFNNKFNFEYNSHIPVNELKIDIYDSFGRLVFSDLINNVQSGFKTEINLAGFSPGIYFIRAGSEEDLFFSRKLIKK